MVAKITHKDNRDIRTAILASFGTALAYYDFAIFGMMAKYLADVFFSSISIDSGILYVYLMFSLAYFARPVGGLIFGLIGDRFGRKISLLLVTLIMATSTFAIGFLPTGYEVGIVSGIFLALLRLLQGFSYGAELPGVLVVVAEHTNLSKLASRCSIVMSITGLGTVLSTLVLYLLSSILDYEEIISWGWRLPFMFGGVLAIINCYLRMKVFESSNIETTNQNIFSPLKKLLSNYSLNMIFGVLLSSFCACLILMDIYFITYYPDNYSYTVQDMYFIRIITKIISSIFLIFFGLVVDRIGSFKVIVYDLCAFLICTIIYVIFDPMQNGKISSLIVFLSLYEIFLVAYIAAFIPVILNLFETNVRFTGMAICYSFGFVVVGLCPQTFSQMIAEYDEPLVIFMLPVCLALAVILAVIAMNLKPMIIKFNHAT